MMGWYLSFLLMSTIPGYKFTHPFFAALRLEHPTFFDKKGTELLGPSGFSLPVALLRHLNKQRDAVARQQEVFQPIPLSKVVCDTLKRGLMRLSPDLVIPLELDPTVYADVMAGVTIDMLLTANKSCYITQPLWLRFQCQRESVHLVYAGTGTTASRMRKVILEQVVYQIDNQNIQSGV